MNESFHVTTWKSGAEPPSKADCGIDSFGGWSLKKLCLYSLIASVTLSAAFAMYVILIGRFGRLESRVVATAITIAAASVAGLACRASLVRSRYHVIPLAGLGLTCAAGTMVIAGIWADIFDWLYWQIAIVATVFAVACAHLSLLSLVRLAERFRGVLIAAHIIILGVAFLLADMVVLEHFGGLTARLVGIGTIATAALTVLLPILHWLSKPELTAVDLGATEVKYAALDAEIVGLRNRLAALEQLRRTQVGARTLQ